ncbi:MAG: Mrp/NBP35 family ATP-binding protein [Spirochaetes bacterium]|nr:Mrp/NBP35 family ATP-binding protein [Spirochaetota bacterium]
MFGKKKDEEKQPASTAADTAQAMSKADEERMLKENLGRIKNKVVVLSGKGGVGKSTVAVNMAAALAARGLKVGLLDVDIHGPSVPKLMGLEGSRLEASVSGMLLPVETNGGIRVMSIGFMLESADSAVIWRGPLKYGVIKQFLKDVTWGDLDVLVIDSPPGTGDEPLSVCQLIENPTGAVVVTTPQDVAITDVRKSISFCRQLNMPVLGVVENMSGFVCPHCGKETPIFKNGGGETMAKEMGVPFLGRVPIEPNIAENGDAGKPFGGGEKDTAAFRAFESIVENIMKGVTI